MKNPYFVGAYFKTNGIPYYVRIDRDGNAQLVWGHIIYKTSADEQNWKTKEGRLKEYQKYNWFD